MKTAALPKGSAEFAEVKQLVAWESAEFARGRPTSPSDAELPCSETFPCDRVETLAVIEFICVELRLEGRRRYKEFAK